ncbi:MAG: trigger factor [Verrucomicrobia bacterium]|nr:trigger factor [Verrucomicrobiota bacterium]
MNIEIKDVSETRKSLVVTLDQAEVAAEHQAVIGEISKQARLPGFRPGKAPASLVLKRYAKEIGDEFKQKVLAKAYRGGLEQSKIEALNITDVQEGTLSPDQAATVTITLDIRPTFTLPDYAGIATEVKSVEATDAEVDTVIEGMRAERADFKVAERPSQKGDYVKLAYEGTIDGKPVLELAADKQIYGKVPQTWEEVEGENEGLIPGLGKQLAGLKAGDKKDVTITFPAEFPAVPALAGKTAVYAVEVQEIRERVLPPMDEAFFKAHQADDLESLKVNVRNNLKGRKEYENRQAQRRQVTEVLNAKVDFAIPESLVEHETQSVLRQFIEENMRRGVSADQFEKDKQQLHDGASKAARTRVKTQLILAKIAEQEKITVTEKDIDTFIYRESVMNNQKPEKLVKELTQDREKLRSVQQSIIFDKALDLLVSKATVTTASAQA